MVFEHKMKRKKKNTKCRSLCHIFLYMLADECTVIFCFVWTVYSEFGFIILHGFILLESWRANPKSRYFSFKDNIKVRFYPRRIVQIEELTWCSQPGCCILTQWMWSLINSKYFSVTAWKTIWQAHFQLWDWRNKGRRERRTSYYRKTKLWVGPCVILHIQIHRC